MIFLLFLQRLNRSQTGVGIQKFSQIRIRSRSQTFRNWSGVGGKKFRLRSLLAQIS